MEDLEWLPTTLRAAAVFVAALVLYPAIAWIDRRAQLRPGERAQLPRHPLLPFAFALKLLSKRAALSASADRALHFFAPFFGFIPGLLVLACLPPGPTLRRTGAPLHLGVTVADVSLPLAFGLLFLSTSGILLAGWAGGNHLALLSAVRLGLVRLAALLVFALGAAGIVFVGGSLHFADLLTLQSQPLPGGIPGWGILRNPIGFGTTLVALGIFGQRLAQSRPDEHAEFVAPYAEESTGPTLLFHRYFEVVDLMASAALLATLFGGGWTLPLLDADLNAEYTVVAAGARVVVFVLKTLLFASCIVWIRRALPLLRHDQALRLLWALVPVAALGLWLSIFISLN